MGRQNNIIIACIGIPMAILAIGATVWGIFAYKRNRKADTQQEQIEALIEDVKTLKQQPASALIEDVETLEQQPAFSGAEL